VLSVKVVEVEIEREPLRSLFGMAVDPSVSPFSQERLDEAFCFAVGLRSVGSSSLGSQAQLATGGHEALGDVAAAVVGENGAGLDSFAGKPGHGPLEEGDSRVLALIGEDLNIGESRVIIDADVDKLPAAASSPLPVVAGDTMSDGADAAQLLDVQVQELTGKLLFVAPHRLGRLKGAKTTKATALKDASHRRARQAQAGCNLTSRQTSAAQSDDLSHHLCRGLGRHPVRSRRALHEPRRALGPVPGQPPVSRSLAEALGLSRLLHRPPLLAHPPYKQGSTCDAASGILVDVHPGLLSGTDRLGPNQLLRKSSDGQLLSLNNVLRLHT